MLVVTPICFIVLSPGTSDSGSPERHVYDSNSLGRNNHRSKILNKDEVRPEYLNSSVLINSFDVIPLCLSIENSICSVCILKCQFGVTLHCKY